MFFACFVMVTYYWTPVGRQQWITVKLVGTNYEKSHRLLTMIYKHMDYLMVVYMNLE